MWLTLSILFAASALAWGSVLLLGKQRLALENERLGQEKDRLAASFRAGEERLRALVRELPVGIVVHGPRTEILECNRMAVALLGRAEAQLRGKTCFDPQWDLALEDGSSLPGSSHPVARAVDTRQPVRNLVVGVMRPDSWDRVWLLMGAEPQLGHDGSVQRVYCSFADITARKRLESQIEDQSHRDPLTGCFNRRYMAEFEQHAQTTGKQWGCLVVDVAGLKHYNETYGHQAGDDVLVRMSRFLMLQVRAGEAVIRLGGDEFLALLTGVDHVTIEAVVQRILKEALRQAPISFSMGWAAREDAEPLEKTMVRAERGLVTVPVPERAENQRRGPVGPGTPA